MTSDKDSFTESDYDFSGVLKSELDACLFYEYARESRVVSDEILSIRQQHREANGKSIQLRFGHRIQTLIADYILTSLSSVSGFPTTPWQCLSDKEKRLVLKHRLTLPHVALYGSTWHNPPLIFSLKEEGATTLDAWNKKRRERLPSIPNEEPIKSGFFAVNMKYGHAVLIEEFAKYLRHFEGKPMLDFPTNEKRTTAPKPPGRKSAHDILNALGAMRLRYHCGTFSEAQIIMQPLKSKSHGLFYGRRDSFNRACESALAYFHRSVGWVDLGNPIHFTTGWGDTKKPKAFQRPH